MQATNGALDRLAQGLMWRGFEKEVALFECPKPLPGDTMVIKGIQIQALRNDGGFWPLMELSVDHLPDDFLHVFKVVIKGHTFQSKDSPEA